MQLWDCNYGYGKYYATFFALFPLNDAPYTAAYEEAEVFCTLNEYIKLGNDAPLPESVRLLVSEYIRYLIDRACYYYPPMLPEAMLSKDIKTGELNRNLWIVLEDIQDGWLQSGSVGQEVYGSGNAFGIVPRHYFPVPNTSFSIFVDYPVLNFNVSDDEIVSLDILGSKQGNCRLVITKTGNIELPGFTVRLSDVDISNRAKMLNGGHLEYDISGGQRVDIRWHGTARQATPFS